MLKLLCDAGSVNVDEFSCWGGVGGNLGIPVLQGGALGAIAAGRSLRNDKKASNNRICKLSQLLTVMEFPMKTNSISGKFSQMFPGKGEEKALFLWRSLPPLPTP